MQETQSTRRLHWLLWAILAWVGVILMRLIWLQVIQHDALLRLAEQQQQRLVEIQAMRGAILDRAGQPLARSLPSESVCVNPQKIPDPEVAADLLSRVLEMDRVTLLEKLRKSARRGSGFLWVKRRVTAEEAARVRSLKLDWVEFRPEMRRFYPHHTLAAHVLGSIGMASDDAVEHGTAGVEESFEEDLAGQPGLARIFNDVKQNPYDSVIARSPDPGANLKLTIDLNLQYDSEKELERAVVSNRARSGSVIALNPYTGEILALANYPTYDPNQPPGPDEPPGARSNLAIAAPFEPGSVLKVVTLTSALETTNLTPDTMINCGHGSINLFGRVIHDDGAHRYSFLSMADVLAHSSNIGAIQIALKVGDRGLYRYERRFGLGQKTGVDLPGESSGMLRRVEQWSPSSIGSIAMGHEIGITSLQLALAGAAIANGGLLVKPRLVLSRQKPGGAEESLPAEKPHRIMAPETAIKMRQMMEGVVLYGTGHRYATLKGYTSGGKTGSAQIYDFKAHAYTHHYNASFLGFAPVVNPQIVIAVTVEGTSGGSAGFGAPVAAPVFREVAMSALRMIDVPKDLPDGVVRASKGPVNEDDLAIAGIGQPPPLAMPDALSPADSQIAQEFVSSVPPPPAPGDSTAPAAESTRDRRPFLNPILAGPKVPDFRGMTLRAVLEESAASGLQLEVSGNGLARDQDPPPGSMLPPGQRVRVQFAR